jgi:hypothetical protein
MPQRCCHVWMTGQLTVEGIQLVIMIILRVQGDVDLFTVSGVMS